MDHRRDGSGLRGARESSAGRGGGVGFAYGDLNEMLTRYDPEKLSHGYNTVDGEDVFFIANPGLGLWAHKSRLTGAESPSQELSSTV
jgi:hypothetical protein